MKLLIAVAPQPVCWRVEVVDKVNSGDFEYIRLGPDVSNIGVVH